MISLGCFGVWFACLRNGEDVPPLGHFIFAVLSFSSGTLAYYNLGDEAVKRVDDRERACIEERRQERTPRFYADAPDGCKVYTFKPGDRWLYFTRCPNSKTSTETTWVEQCGKNCSKTVSSTIESH